MYRGGKQKADYAHKRQTMPVSRSEESPNDIHGGHIG